MFSFVICRLHRARSCQCCCSSWNGGLKVCK